MICGRRCRRVSSRHPRMANLGEQRDAQQETTKRSDQTNMRRENDGESYLQEMIHSRMIPDEKWTHSVLSVNLKSMCGRLQWNHWVNNTQAQAQTKKTSEQRTHVVAISSFRLVLSANQRWRCCLFAFADSPRFSALVYQRAESTSMRLGQALILVVLGTLLIVLAVNSIPKGSDTSLSWARVLADHSIKSISWICDDFWFTFFHSAQSWSRHTTTAEVWRVDASFPNTTRDVHR